MIFIKIFLGIALNTIIFSSLHSQMPTLVEVDKVIEQPINQSVPVIGSILPKRESNLMSSVAGRVDKVLVEEGDSVKKGKVLAFIDIKNYEWLYEISSSNLLKAKYNYEKTKTETLINELDLKRMEALKSTSAFNASIFDKLENTKLILKSKEEIALAELNIENNKNKIAKLNYEKSIIKAPFTGIIEQRMIEVGEVVGVGTPMLNLVDKSDLEVFAEVPSFRIYGLKKGSPIKIRTTDNINIEGTIRAIGAKENPTTRTVKIYLDFKQDSLPRKLLVGENINLLIPIDFGRKAVTVHKDAILKREGMSLVYLVKGNKVEVKTLKLGEAVGNRFIVIKGLSNKDNVVIKGNERLRPGQEVNIINNSK